MTAPRIAIYARLGTSRQNPLSGPDQIFTCRKLVEQLGGEVVSIHSDQGMSGNLRNRPGIAKLVHEISQGSLDIVLCEALDRITRDGNDLSWFHNKLQCDGVELWAVPEGKINEHSLTAPSDATLAGRFKDGSFDVPAGDEGI